MRKKIPKLHYDNSNDNILGQDVTCAKVTLK